MNERPIENPVRTRVREADEARGDFHRLDAVLAAFEMLLRFDALLLANLMTRVRRPLPPLAIDRLRRHSISLGDWLMLVEVLAPLVPDGVATHRWVRREHARSSGSRLHRMIAIRNDRAHGERRADPARVTAARAEVDSLWSAMLEEHPSHEDLELASTDSIVMQSSRLEVSGPFLQPACDLQPPQLLLFAGRRKGSFIWTSPQGLERSLDSVAHGVLEGGSIADATDRPMTLAALRDRAQELTAATIRMAVDAKRYRPRITVARSELEGWIDHMLADRARVVLLEGPELCGKTTALCRFSEAARTAGRQVLFISCREVEQSLEGAIGAAIGCGHDPRSSLTRLASICPRGELLLVLDDLGLDPRGLTASAKALRWLVDGGQSLPIRTLAAGRTEHIRDLIAAGDRGEIPWIRVTTVPPLRRHELATLAERLGSNPEVPAHRDTARRSALATRISASRDPLVRRAGISAILLERSSTDLLDGGFRLLDAYSAIVNQEVLGALSDGTVRHPDRGVVLSSLAALLAERGEADVPWEAMSPEMCRRLRGDEGPRTIAFQSLIDLGLLVEESHGFGIRIRFVDPRMAAYCVAAPLGRDARVAMLTTCVRRLSTWPLAVHAAAMCIALETSDRALTAGLDWSAVPAERTSQIASELAMMSPGMLPSLFSHFYSAHPVAAIAFVENLLHTAQAQLARQLSYCVQIEPPRTAADHAMRLLRARSLYELDDYRGVLDEVSAMAHPVAAEVKAIEADTLATIDYDRALAAWEQLTGSLPHDSSTIRGICLRGTGYAMLRLGRLLEAKSVLEQALPMLEGRYRNRYYSEALGELAETSMQLGRLDEAERCLDLSWRVSSDAGFTVALGIIEGQRALLAIARGRFEEAESCLLASLRIHEMVDNLWRQAWTYKHLSHLYARMGREVDQVGARGRCEALCRELGISAID